MYEFKFRVGWYNISIYKNDVKKYENVGCNADATNKEVLEICQKWLDDSDLTDVEYNVTVRLH